MSGRFSPSSLSGVADSHATAPLVIGLHAMLCAAAFMASAWLFWMGMLAVIATEFLYARFFPEAYRSLEEISFGLNVRSGLRAGAILLTGASAGGGLGHYSTATVALGAMFVAVHVFRRVYEHAVDQSREIRGSLVETHNLHLPGLRMPKNPPRWLTAKRRVPPVLEALTVLSVTAGIVTGLPALSLSCAGLALGVHTGMAAVMSAHFRSVCRLAEGDRLSGAATQRIIEHEPEVALYFAGQPETAYQVNMWLGVLEKAERNAVVILRERALAARLGPTSLPVICIPESPDAMALRIPSLRVILYPANTKKNMDMLRNPALKHVFIGHGDSDKVASFNPVSRVFDEIWVAGPAGRDRYRKAQVGVDDNKIVEVGRPQLSPIKAGMTGNPVFTVLYAPTWEGWVDDLNHTSVPVMGARLIERLLRASFPIQVIYKPHPMAGRLSPQVRAADDTIRRLLDSPEHEVVTGRKPTLYECFNRADVLISDVSSVISDFLASGKPYITTNIEERDAEQFRAAYPSTEAAYLLSPDCDELPEILAQIRRGGANQMAPNRMAPDRMAPARATLRDFLLGRATVSPQTRFNDALASLIKRGEEGAINVHK